MAFLLDWKNRTKKYIQEPEDLNSIKPGLQFLGRMPKTAFLEEDLTFPFNPETHDSEYFNEHIRHITESMQAFSPHEDSREWLITSPDHHQGKSLLAQNLAKVLAQQASQRVLLMDANISHPTLQKMVPHHTQKDKSEGLSDFLCNKAKINSIVQNTQIPNLHVITTGKWPTLPPEVFRSDRFGQLLQWCKEAQFHVIIIGPPVLPGVDILDIVNQVNETIIVFRPEVISREDIKYTIHQLDSHGAIISGIVFYQLISEGTMQEVKSARPGTSQPSPPLSWKPAHEGQPVHHQFRDQTTTEQEHKQQTQKPLQPSLLESQRENLRLKAQLQKLQKEREVLLNSVKYFSKFAKNPHKISDLT